MSKFIVIEGLDGSGKSEVSRLVAEGFGGILLKTPPKEIVAARSYIDESNDEKLRFHYYMIGNILVSEKIKELVNMGSIVICDRYVYSTFVYFKFFGLDIDDGEWQGKFKEPDIKIFLDTSYAKRMKRLISRNNNTIFDEKTKSRSVHNGLRNLYLAYPNWLMVDTDHFDGNIEKEVDWIVCKLKSLMA